MSVAWAENVTAPELSVLRFMVADQFPELFAVAIAERL
jgi:hypothetical protein